MTLNWLRHILVKCKIPRSFLAGSSSKVEIIHSHYNHPHLILNVFLLTQIQVSALALFLLSSKSHLVYLCLCSRQLCHCHGFSFAGLTWGLNKIGQNWRKLAQIGPNESWSESWQLIVSWVRVIPGLPGWGWLPGPEANIPDIITQGFTLVQIITNSYNSAMADPLSSTAASGDKLTDVRLLTVWDQDGEVGMVSARRAPLSRLGAKSKPNWV